MCFRGRDRALGAFATAAFGKREAMVNFVSVASRNSRRGQLNGGASGSGNGNGGRREKRESGPEPLSSSTVRKRTRSRSGAENGGSSSMSKRTKVRRLEDDDVPELNKGKMVLEDNVDDSDSIEVIEIEEEVSDNGNGKEMEYMKTDKEVEVIDLDSGEDEMEADPVDKNWGFDESNPIVLTESSEDSDSGSEANANSENECAAVNYSVQSTVNPPNRINLLTAHPGSADSDVLFTFSESEGDNSSDEDFRVDESNEENDVDEDSMCKSKRADGKRKKKSSQAHSNKFEYCHDNDYLGETMPTLETESSGICRNNDNNTAALSGEQQIQNAFKDTGISAVKSGVACSTNLPEEEEENKAEEDSENNDQCVGQCNEKVQYVCKDVTHSSVTCDKLQMNVGSSTKNSEKEAKRAKEKQKAKAATAERLNGDDLNVGMSKNQKEMGPSTKFFKTVEDRNKGKEVQETTKNDGKRYKKEKRLVAKEKLGSSNDSNLVELLADCVLGKHNTSKSHPLQSEIEVNVDAEPPSSEEAIPLKFTFGNDEPKPVEKSEFEKDLDSLWEEYDMFSKLDEIGVQVGKEEKGLERGSERTPATHCSHEYALDDEIGMCCRICHHIAIEIRYISPLVEKYYCLARSGQRRSSGEADIPFFDGIQFKAGENSSQAVFNNSEGTVWDMIPGVKEDLHPHQQEGFEFVWTNLTGTTELHKLKNADPNSPGGCIINHAPGTGKTRLTIEFLKSYLELFPLCHPVIIAPASVLLTWEDEFKKWDNVIPFHNMSIPELSGKELVVDSSGMIGFSCRSLKRNDIRLLKLLSWYQQKSILGISYTLYEKIAGESTNAKRAKQSEVMRKVLRETPSLLVLDEGHTPRNKGTQIFKVLSEIKTGNRILLSGTPFQNNFLELYNILCLVKPSFADGIPEDLKKFCQSKRLIQEKKRVKHMRWKEVASGNFNGYSNDQAIDELKMLMAPFVHVHENSILHKSLPGLVECVVILNPCNKQKEILEIIKSSQSAFAFESRLALPSIHPSLLLYCALSEEEKSLVDRDLLEQVKPDPYEGAKTRFLVDFIRLCEAVNEKVIVFSQFIDPLNLIKDHLHSLSEWSEGKEVLQMDGTLEQKQRQSLIHNFNDPNSNAKVLLASTRACSEGINLTGASRVILLDVEWNPAVERQAISRAYRLGQKKVVYTYQLITKDTEEWSKYLRMAEKERISKRVFSASKNVNDKQKSSVVAQEDKVLDNMVQHEKLKDIFDSIIYQPKEKILGQSS
ncbi:hypothetical protein L6164_002124 [Bauhinia variegata]|uniref:Uncharacterized protein n=1 Tax=Bauhinia variegata TaxID=167791 RepID=A0ACB9PYQ6_BAUVA|nr:hypothetical protein L6164_002124 [Bauhinia variegata]